MQRLPIARTRNWIRFIVLAAPAIGMQARAGVTVQEVPSTEGQVNYIRQSDFGSAQIGGPPPSPWLCSKPGEKARVFIETPPGHPATERWVRLVDNSDKESANIHESFAPVTSGRFQARVISNKAGGRLFFNLGNGGASKPEERALQLIIGTDGSLEVHGGRKARSSMLIKTGEVYLVRCDFEPSDNGNGFRVRTELVEENTQQENHLETEIPTQLAISAVRVTSTTADTGVDFYVTGVSLTSR